MEDWTREQLERMGQVLKMLGHPQRLELLRVLAREGEAPVHVLTGVLGLAQSATSHHLDRLKRVGLIGAERRGKEVWYRVIDPGVLVILDCIGKTGASE